MGKRRLNLPNKDDVIIYLADQAPRRVKAFEIAKHFNIFPEKSFGPADASRDIGYFLSQCHNRAFKKHDAVFFSSHDGHFLAETEQDCLLYDEYVQKKCDGLRNMADKKIAKVRNQIKSGSNPFKNDLLRKLGFLN
jgi:hypothetical protein